MGSVRDEENFIEAMPEPPFKNVKRGKYINSWLAKYFLKEVVSVTHVQSLHVVGGKISYVHVPIRATYTPRRIPRNNCLCACAMCYAPR